MNTLSTVYEVRITTGGRHISLLFFGQFGLFLAGTASAQTQDIVPPPPGTEAGQIRQHFEVGGVGAPPLQFPGSVVEDGLLMLSDNAEQLRLSLPNL